MRKQAAVRGLVCNSRHSCSRQGTAYTPSSETLLLIVRG